jgi:hypothetical protein
MPTMTARPLVAMLRVIRILIQHGVREFLALLAMIMPSVLPFAGDAMTAR